MKQNVYALNVFLLSEKDTDHQPQNFNFLKKRTKRNHFFSIKSFFTIILLFSFASFGQEKLDDTYKIIANPTNENLDSYISAMNNSNFECFRFETTNRILVFKSGVTVELLSYKQVTESGNPQVNNCFISDTEIVKTYELELIGNKIVILAPIDPSIKHY